MDERHPLVHPAGMLAATNQTSNDYIMSHVQLVKNKKFMVKSLVAAIVVWL